MAGGGVKEGGVVGIRREPMGRVETIDQEMDGKTYCGVQWCWLPIRCVEGGKF